MGKICKKCGASKIMELFEKGRAICKVCRQIQKTLWAQKFRDENRDKYNASQKAYYTDHKSTILARIDIYQKSNSDKIKTRHKAYYAKNKDKILKQEKVYRELNIDKIKARKNKWAKKARKSLPSFKIRENISRSINRALTIVGLSKNGKSCLKYLPYTITELKSYIESKFESWMNWNNYGKYNVKTWNDSDTSTWTWQIDHIIPASTFSYTSMEDQSFKECWALENIRPLSSKQNWLDGVSRIRHKGKILNAL
jgi:hypothetical protein